MHGLGGLVAEGASRGVLQAAAGEAVGRPTSVQAGEPVEEADARRCPVFPGEFPGGVGRGAGESGHVGRLGRVDAVRAPSPDEAIGLGREGRARDLVPKLEVLPDLVDANRALDISRPTIVRQPIHNSPEFATAFGDARV